MTLAYRIFTYPELHIVYFQSLLHQTLFSDKKLYKADGGESIETSSPVQRLAGAIRIIVNSPGVSCLRLL